MLQVKIIAVGKIKEKYMQEGIKEYVKRLRSYARLNIIEVDDEPCPEKASALEEARIKQKEAERLLKAISERAFVILLDIKGQELSSTELAQLFEERALSGQSDITFVIGGSLGISKDIESRANLRWSFSKLTFPHQMIRLVLLEQVYRACKINKGEPYHK
ncbi:MAG: 23S rRNA (pseudouridine(1915)-N(3))-methyltransferase RlmH [Gracilibacter sp. BRH_c7a]|nr:MAG: 23S rRNA (pseudouridine(1915)-N(3))-methyltransferase RlmH [Gracilibacter sp. BRH_c7a]